MPLICQTTFSLSKQTYKHDKAAFLGSADPRRSLASLEQWGARPSHWQRHLFIEKNSRRVIVVARLSVGAIVPGSLDVACTVS